MSLIRHTRATSPHTRTLDLPPPFRLVRLREAGDAFMHARTHAAELGAGTLICVGHFDRAELAVVLEPDEPLASAWHALYAAMVALTDGLAASAPPQMPIVVEWPDAIRMDGRLIGGGRLAWPDGADEAAPPPWLVFGAMIRAERFTDIDLDRLVESFARHLMRVIDHWREAGFAAIADDYVSRLEREPGARRTIGDRGELLLTRSGQPMERRWLHPRLAAPSWLDPHSGEPRG
jgi:biotin/lipoate A/B protein ligase family protein